MEPLQCVAVDDDDLALNLLEDFVESIDHLEWAGGFDHALEALTFLEQHPIDLLVVDVHMPRMNGLDLLRSLQRKPATIISSSHAEYAIEGFRLDVVDYLLKPYSFERFEHAIQKASDYLQFQRKKQMAGHFWVKVDYQMAKISFEEVRYIEACKQYVNIATESEVILTQNSLKNLEIILPQDMFMRVHKSYIISTNWLIKKAADHVVVGNKKIPVGRSYRKNIG